MVCVKAKPLHANMRPDLCVVIVYKNPIRYSIWQFKEYFLCDEETRRKKQYKNHVHTTPEKLSPVTATKMSPDPGCYPELTDTSKFERSVIGYRNSYQL